MFLVNIKNHDGEGGNDDVDTMQTERRKLCYVDVVDDVTKQKGNDVDTMSNPGPSTLQCQLCNQDRGDMNQKRCKHNFGEHCAVGNIMQPPSRPTFRYRRCKPNREM